MRILLFYLLEENRKWRKVIKNIIIIYLFFEENGQCRKTVSHFGRKMATVKIDVQYWGSNMYYI